MPDPISIEDLVRKKREAQEAQRKPRFISKAERAKLAENRSSGSAVRTNVPTPETRKVVMAQEEHTDSEPGFVPRRKKKTQKFLFDWKQTDDTTSEDPIYNASTGSTTGSSGQPELSGAQERLKRLREIEQVAANKKLKSDLDDVHWTKKSLDKMSSRDWRIFKEDFSIVTRGGGTGTLPPPIRFWSESKIPSRILEVVTTLGFKDPTPIQRAAIPIALTNRDVIGIAETGSGKTLSFVIPLLSYIMELPAVNAVTKSDGPYAIVLAPTRELAQQIEIHAKPFCDHLGFRVASIIGGHSIEQQAHKIQDGAELIVATPGRLVDFIERRLLVLNQCCYVVMDEADRMIDLGFEESVNKILSSLPSTNKKPDSGDSNSRLATLYGVRDPHRMPRQTMMFTATWPREIEKMAANYLQKPGIVTIGNINQATDRVEQRVEFVAGEDRRLKRLVQLLERDAFAPPIIIFVNLRRNCDIVAKALDNAGWRAVTMHGSKTQEQRETALSQLRQGVADCLVATDVAGRGIDVPDVSLVINFQMAKSIEDYTHRIGRTGRAGKKGVAITFLGQEDDGVLYDLRQMISRSEISKVPLELKRHEAAQTRQPRDREREQDREPNEQ